MRRMKLIDITTEQGKAIAAFLGTTWNSLRAAVHGRRGVSSLRAIRIERAARRLGLDIKRESLNAGCAECEFAKACRKTVKVKPK